MTSPLSIIEASCPYCGETIALLVDCSLTGQSYIEDCEVCCRPITITLALDDEGEPLLRLQTESDC